MMKEEVDVSLHAADEPFNPEELTGLAAQLSDLLTKERKQTLTQAYQERKDASASSRKDADKVMLDQVQSYLKLHDDLHSSQALLEELDSFLTVFHNDLSVLSNQMNALQSKSLLLRQRLQNRRALEEKLRTMVSNTILDPRYIEVIFSDDANSSRANLDVWKECVEKLSGCLLACTEFESLMQKGESSSVEAQSVKEAREVAESCRIMAITKLRPLLISTFAPLRSSLSTNLPVLQSVLLRSYRPLFMFLSQHAPRVAIDVQRAYVAAARLYFETGFRRYERSLAKIRDKEKARRYEQSQNIAFAEPSSKPAFDPWMPDPSTLDNVKIADGPAVTLAYLADDASYRTTIEALYRSLSLTFLDNASSEYCFLARYFEGVDIGVHQSRHIDVLEPSERMLEGEHSKTDGTGEDGAETPSRPDALERDQNRDAGSIVRLSETEKLQLKGRAAIDELWKQVMEPALGTYTNFVTSILNLNPPLIPLYTMVQLNERMLEEIETRGCTSVLQSELMAFKLKAWPMIQRQFDDVIDSIKKLNSGQVGSATPGGASSFLGGLGGFFGGQNSSQDGDAGAIDNLLLLVCERYGHLFSSVAYLHGNDPDEHDTTIFHSIGRLRSEIEVLLNDKAKSAASSSIISRCHQAIRQKFETGPASLSLGRMQAELSHWRESHRGS